MRRPLKDGEHVTDAEFTVIRGPDVPPPVVHQPRPSWWARDPDKPDKPWDWRFYTQADKVRYWIAYAAWLVFVLGAIWVIAQVVTHAVHL